MIKVNYNNLHVDNGQVVELDQIQSVPDVSWNYMPRQLYTLILYDDDAREQAPDNVDAPFALWLVINIPQDHVKNGDILLNYMLPTIDKDNHYLILAIYHQMDQIPYRHQNRVNFELQPFIRHNSLQKLGSIEFYVDNSKNQNYKPPANYYQLSNYSNYSQNYSSTGTNGYTGTIVSRPSYPYQKVDMFRQNYFDNDKLDNNQQKYCRCVASVQSSADPSCQEQIWGKANCVNPKQQCVDLLNNDSIPSCSNGVDFFAMPDDDLIAYAQLEDIEIPYPYNRSEMIANLIDNASQS